MFRKLLFNRHDHHHHHHHHLKFKTQKKNMCCPLSHSILVWGIKRKKAFWLLILWRLKHLYKHFRGVPPLSNRQDPGAWRGAPHMCYGSNKCKDHNCRPTDSATHRDQSGSPMSSVGMGMLARPASWERELKSRPLLQPPGPWGRRVASRNH